MHRVKLLENRWEARQDWICPLSRTDVKMDSITVLQLEKIGFLILESIVEYDCQAKYQSICMIKQEQYGHYLKFQLQDGQSHRRRWEKKTHTVFSALKTCMSLKSNNPKSSKAD